MTGTLMVRNGIWYCLLHYVDADNNRKQKWISTGLPERGNKKQASIILQEKIEEYSVLEPQEIIKPHTDKSKGNYILWLDWLIKFIDEAKLNLSPVCAYSYDTYYRKLMTEYWGPKNIYLQELTTEDILTFYDTIKKERNLKNITLKRYANIIRPALRKAFLEKLIKENPYDAIPPIKREPVKHNFYDQEEMEQLFKAIEGHKFELEYKLLAYYGLRRSELIGLTWDAVDFTNKTIAVRKKVLVVKKEVIISDTMKTITSNRTLPLIPKIEHLLLKQKRRIDESKRYYGKHYNNKYENFICVNEYGNLITPDHLTKTFRDLLKENNLKQIRLHDLRHSCASIMLANGVHMKQIQEWLGHSNFSTTADIYSHLDYSSKVQSAEIIANVLDGKKTDDGNNGNENEIQELEALKEEMNKLGIKSISELLQAIQKNK